MKILIALALIPLAIWGLQLILGTFVTGAAIAAEGDGPVPKGCGFLIMLVAVGIVIFILSNL